MFYVDIVSEHLILLLLIVPNIHILFIKQDYELKIWVGGLFDETYFSRLTTLCTHLLWMRIVSAEELYTASGYVINTPVNAAVCCCCFYDV